jgi:hypothetical protein
LEATLMFRILEESGSDGPRFLELQDQLYALNRTSEAIQTEMLDRLFHIVFGERTTVVSSEDLLAAGFDDSKQPNPFDFL